MENTQNSSQVLQVLNHSELLGRQFTVYGTADQPLFLARDIAEMIEYDMTSVNKLVGMVDEDERVRNIFPTLGGNQQGWFLTEDGLYEVLMQSRKPIAKEFKKGVKAILKEIRTKGGYIAAQPEESADVILARALKLADETLKRTQAQLVEAAEQNERLCRQVQVAEGTIEEQGKQIKALTPDAEYTANVLQSKETYTWTQIAKDLCISSASKLLDILKQRGIVFKQSGQWMPTSRFVGKGYFTTRTALFFHHDGTQGSSISTVVTELGRKWLHSIIGKEVVNA